LNSAALISFAENVKPVSHFDCLAPFLFLGAEFLKIGRGYLKVIFVDGALMAKKLAHGPTQRVVDLIVLKFFGK
jgi:hypothetical protein